VLDVFHRIRKTGNDATHDFVGTQREALFNLQLVRRLAVWFHRSFGRDGAFKAGSFIPPPDPAHAAKATTDELDELRARLAAQELEQQKTQFEQKTAEILSEATAKPAKTLDAILEHAQQEGQDLALSEPETRRLIDAQLREAGWEADSETLSYANGPRPLENRNMAIAEWPTESGPADYALFVGLTCVGVVEAKRKNKDCSAAIEQAKRYSRGIHKAPLHDASPWSKYRVPFLFSTNGRPYLRQIETKSGIWFLDARVSTNHPRALSGWRTPGELYKDLDLDVPAANKRLTAEPKDYLPLRLRRQGVRRPGSRPRHETPHRHGAVARQARFRRG
jgi:type I restriction enzyme R subunit